MRVLFANPNAELGGSGRSLLDVLAALGTADPSLERRLVLFAAGELAERTRALGVPVDVLPLPSELGRLGESAGDAQSALATARALGEGLARTPSYVAELRRCIRAAAPDIVHTNGMKAHFLCRLAAPGLPLVVHLRDFAGARRVSRHLWPAFRSRSVVVVTNSRAVADDVRSQASGLATRVVYNAIDLDEFRPGPRELAPLARAAGLPEPTPDAVVIGLVATYAHWKGHHTFVRAMAEVRRRLAGRSLRFYLVGGPVYGTRASELDPRELERAVNDAGLAGDLGLVPFQRDAGRVYRGLDVVVHASTRPEPFGRTIVEAMASGRAVVAARAGGALELVSEGETGLFHEPGDSDSLARAVSSLVTDPELRARLGSAARQSAERRFERSRLARELLDVYRELSSSGRTAPRVSR